MRKLLVFVSMIILFFGCGKDKSTPNNVTTEGIKKGDNIEYKIINSVSTSVYLDFVYFNATEAEVVQDSYSWKSGTFIVYNTVKNSQKVGFTVRCNDRESKVDLQVIVNNVVIKSGYVGNGVGYCALNLQ